MKKLWSFFWWVVAVCIAATILLEILAPYIWLIILVFVGVVVVAVGFRVWKYISNRRSHY